MKATEVVGEAGFRNDLSVKAKEVIVGGRKRELSAILCRNLVDYRHVDAFDCFACGVEREVQDRLQRAAGVADNAVGKVGGVRDIADDGRLSEPGYDHAFRIQLIVIGGDGEVWD